jgi:ribonuclease III
MTDLPRLTAVETALGHRFSDHVLLIRACTHSSHLGAQANAATRLAEANERLEFLGDAVLGGALCALLFRRSPLADEGLLSREKALLASRSTLARLFTATGLEAHCLLGQQMQRPLPDSVKANLMEALLGAIFLDGGWGCLMTAVEKLYAGDLAGDGVGGRDAKTALQEWALAHHRSLPVYHCERSGGSDHEPLFAAVVTVGELSASGTGSSRRRAEAAAAAALSERLRSLEAESRES